MKPLSASSASAGSCRESRSATRQVAPAGHGPITSECLLCGRKMVEIIHNGVIYRLQATKYGKLILTK